MSIQFDIWAVLLAIAVFQGLFISPLLFRKRTSSAKWLTGLVLILTFMVFSHLAINVRLYRLWPHFLGLELPLIFLIGPVYYFYIKSLLDRQFRLKWTDGLHMIPCLVAYFNRGSFFLLPPEDKISRLDAALEATQYDVSISFIIPIAIHVAQTLVYLVLANQQLRKVNASANERNLQFKKWLQGFTFGFGAYWIATFLWMLYLTLANAFFHEVDYINVLFTACLVNVLAYVSVYHNQEFSQYMLSLLSEKYQKSSLSPEQSKSLLQKIVKVMEEEKPYLDSDLKISDLARSVSTTTNIVSQVLNQETNKNFFEFVNSYRIAEAMKRLSDPEFSHISILGIAMDAGFSNKNTFNRLFKKHTGLTPTQFIRNMA